MTYFAVPLLIAGLIAFVVVASRRPLGPDGQPSVMKALVAPVLIVLIIVIVVLTIIVGLAWYSGGWWWL